MRGKSTKEQTICSDAATRTPIPPRFTLEKVPDLGSRTRLGSMGKRISISESQETDLMDDVISDEIEEYYDPYQRLMEVGRDILGKCRVAARSPEIYLESAESPSLELRGRRHPADGHSLRGGGRPPAHLGLCCRPLYRLPRDDEHQAA